MPKRVGTAIADFDIIQTKIRKNPQSNEITDLIANLGLVCVDFLHSHKVRELTTTIPNKNYISFIDSVGKSSRSVNLGLLCDYATIQRFLSSLKTNTVTSDLTTDEITKACYTITVSFACVVDLINPGDKQTPGTFFEYLMRHILSRYFNVVPSERVKVKVGDDEISLTIDLIFDPGGKEKYHFAIKTSTRERASEFWAHQRILEKAYPIEKFKGIFIGLAETKLDHKSYVVTEICVPDQWRAYQEYISKIDRIYYLDPPAAYLRLNYVPPFIPVKPFGDYFFDSLVSP